MSSPNVREQIARLYTLEAIGRFTTLRAKAAREAGGQEAPGTPNIAKLLQSQMVRLGRDVGLEIIGPHGTLHEYDADRRSGAEQPDELAAITRFALEAQGPPIYGGTDQVQRNILGERVLGLPKDGGSERTLAFRDLPKNN